MKGFRILLSFSLSLAASSCMLEPDATRQTLPKAASYVLPTANMCDYWYPKSAGYLYVYTNILREFSHGPANLPDSIQGACDTLRTLGYADISTPNGDSLFALSITYQVLPVVAGRPSLGLRYLQSSQTFTGAFIDTAASISGETIANVPKAFVVSTDSVLPAAAGRIRELTAGFGSNESKCWQTDTVYFSQHGDSVALWGYDGQHNLSVERIVFCESFDPGASWTYGGWENSTKSTVINADTLIATPTHSFRSVLIGQSTSSYQLPLTELKAYGYLRGLVDQLDGWWITKDGHNCIYHTIEHQLNTIMLDNDEE